MTKEGSLEELRLFSIKGVQMRSLHIAWFAWFGLAPLMPVIKQTLHLRKEKVGYIIIANDSGTILARLIIGAVCNILWPKRTYVWLLCIGAVPVMLVGLATSYLEFLIFRVAISIIGASFIITQFHTTLMFLSKIKATASAITSSWENLGGMLFAIVFKSEAISIQKAL